MSQQKLYKGMGDIGNIFVRDGEYEAEVYQDYEDDGGRTRIQVYRFNLDRLTVKNRKLVNQYGHEEWFSDKKTLTEVAHSAGRSVAALAKAFCSSKPEVRFWAYHDVGGHWGFDNFDSYPLTLTEKELEKRERGPTARRIRTQTHGYTRPGTFKRRRR